MRKDNVRTVTFKEQTVGITLTQLKEAAQIDKAIIQSGDNSLYHLLVSIDGREVLVVDDQGRGLCSRSKNALQQTLTGLPVARTVLRHISAYDEMIGHPVREGSNALEVPLADIEHSAPLEPSRR